MKNKSNQMTVSELASMGGIARSKKLSAERKSEIARNAARNRWQKKNENNSK